MNGARIWAAGGGSGGHVYPALAAAEALRERGASVTYAGTPGRIEEELVRRAGLAFVPVPSAPFRGRSPRALARALTVTVRGTAVALARLRRARPQALYGTGGYACVPLFLAARLLRIPTLLFLPDRVPGLAGRVLARLSTRVAVATSPPHPTLPAGRTLITGYPLRRAFRAWTREAARAFWHLPPERPLITVYGGSLGARTLNRAVGARMEGWLKLADLIHVCGRWGDYPELKAAASRLPEALRRRYRLYEYLHEEMPAALAAADLVVCRAGASTLGELPYFGLPAILVPFPGVHQADNARYLAEAGGAVVLDDGTVRADPDRLLGTARQILNDANRLRAMGDRMAALGDPYAADRLAEAILELAERG